MMTAPPVSPNRQFSHLSQLPTPSALSLNRSSSSSRSSIGGGPSPFDQLEDSRMTTLCTTPSPASSSPTSRSSMNATGLTLPFPRQTSAEFFSRSNGNSTATSPASATGPGSPYDFMSSGSRPTWPNPASYTFSQAIKRNLSNNGGGGGTGSGMRTPTMSKSTSNIRSKAAGSLICFELALGDRLAAKLDGETTLQSIKEASGVISTELMGDEEEGQPKKLVSTGTASAVQKARQLLDAKLSQTPIRTIVGIKVSDASDSSSLTFVPSTGPHISRFLPLSHSTYRLISSPLPPTTASTPHSVLPLHLSRPRLGSFPSTTSIISDFSLPPSQGHSPLLSSTPGLSISSDDTDPGEEGFFSSRPVVDESSSSPKTPSTLSPPIVTSPSQSSSSTVEEVERGPPPIGNFDERRNEYAKALVDELEFAIRRRSLVRVKLDLGSQEWRRVGRLGGGGGGGGETELGKQRWGTEDIEKWRTETTGSPDPNASTSSSPVSPTFSTSLSSRTARKFLDSLLNGTASGEVFEKKNEISQVHIWHLDKSRASFGCAIAECRGQELRDLPKGNTASGTLVLKKCSTLPSKPFALSIVRPLDSDSNTHNQADGTDLRLKILATSPSLDLSAAMQSATWEVDDVGDFRVKVDLKEERFGKGETEIRWNSRERYENQDGTLRFTLSENRHSDSSKHDYSIELCAPVLNQLLANYALDQAQGKKAKWERAKVRGLIDRLIEFGERFADASRDE
ncbi:hypothetical protein JCM16303_004767 [Sporobolomyces ruberrimus]